ncbi:MAG: hypothetical protein IAB80_04785 [Bacteroidetes bacterium]|uniref:BT4734-like N-terminal domain-containing protein n=1 Tax=Candidatus Cryptobacteroides excrementipullorum TaxID=2840761 RepID=A0A9D9IT62_9BACT|nr:hypothetical protein [Candidatus Cryptobacteroides excrementipullorum]
MTKEYLLSKTLGGADIIQHLIRKEFPDHIMHVKGQDCGECPDPVWADGSIIQVTLDRIPIEGTKMAEYRARYHYPDGQMLDGDAIALAMAYYHHRGEDLSLEQLIARLAEELYVKEPRKPFFKEPEPEQVPEPKPKAPEVAPCPRMSFFRRPIRNTRPCRDASPQDVYKYLVSDYAKANTETLRCIKDPKERSRFKSQNFDYVTPGGIFHSRKESDLVKASGYMVIDFDHISDPEGLVLLLANEENFETILAFRSPSGDGVKWFVALPPDAKKPDGTPFTYGEFFTILSNYVRHAYGYEADPSGKDVCRACFLPHDPDAFLNPFYLEDNYEYDITRFLDGSAE